MTDNPIDVTAPAKAPTTPQKATLGDLECATITVIVSLADESEVIVPMKMIPQYRMMQLSAMIPSAMPPMVDIQHGTQKPIYNYADPAFVAAVGEVSFKRNCLMLAEMVKIDIPGETLEEKAKYIQETFDPIVTDQLIGVVSERREKAKARIVTRAETFH